MDNDNNDMINVYLTDGTRFLGCVKKLWEMGFIKSMKKVIDKVIVYIKQAIYDFFHPSIEDCLKDFAIVEPSITHEEAEKLLQMIRGWKESEDIRH